MPEIREMSSESPKRSGKDVVSDLRQAILTGRFAPGEPLKAQALATEFGVSLTVVREALARLSGESLADRTHNRGFAVPTQSIKRWRSVIESRLVIEPQILRLSMLRGDFVWESRVVAAERRLADSPTGPEGSEFTMHWHEAHAAFHRSMFEGCGNDALLDVADRLWASSALYRHWTSTRSHPADFVDEHRGLAVAAVARDADTAVSLLERHIRNTASALELGGGEESRVPIRPAGT